MILNCLTVIVKLICDYPIYKWVIPISGYYCVPIIVYRLKVVYPIYVRVILYHGYEAPSHWDALPILIRKDSTTWDHPLGLNVGIQGISRLKQVV
jgi:hypothetical protein